MADHPVATGKISTGPQTTGTNVVDKCVFADNQDYVEVITDGAFEFYVTVSGIDPVSPFSAAWRMPAGQPEVRYIPTFGSNPDVRVLSPAGAVVYSVTGINV